MSKWKHIKSGLRPEIIKTLKELVIEITKPWNLDIKDKDFHRIDIQDNQYIRADFIWGQSEYGDEDTEIDIELHNIYDFEFRKIRDDLSDARSEIRGQLCWLNGEETDGEKQLQQEQKFESWCDAGNKPDDFWD